MNMSMTAVQNGIRKKLAQGELALGLGLRQARTVDIAQIAQSCGFDWLFIDMEHNSMGVDTAAQICAAALATGVTPMIRTASHQSFHSTRLLDAGAQGVVVPHVDNAEQAQNVVAFTRFPPLGHRSIPGGMPQLRFATGPVVEALKSINDETFVVVMIETLEGLRNVNEIAAVPGIDALLMGCSDMAAELGLSGQLGHEHVQEALEKIVAACKRHEKVPGVGGVYEEPLMRRYVEKGARLILSGSDLAFMMSGAKARSSMLRAIALDRAEAPSK